MYRLAKTVGLGSDQPLAQPAPGKVFRLDNGRYQLDASGLAATAGMHLGLDDPALATETAARLADFFNRGCYHAACHRQSVFGKQLLGLILMNIHCASPGYMQIKKPPCGGFVLLAFF